MTAPTLTAPAPTPVDPPVVPGQRFRALLAPFDTLSGDGRQIAAPDGDVRTRPLPLPLLYQERLDMAHDGAVVIGAIDTVWVEDGNLWGSGPFDTDDVTAVAAIRRIGGGFLSGISVDLDDVTVTMQCQYDGQPVDCARLDDAEIIDEAEYARWTFVDVATEWRLMGATVCSQGAFAEAQISLDPPPDGLDPDGTTTAASAAGGRLAAFTVTGDTDLPIAARDRTWDGAAASARQADRAGGVGDLDPAMYAQGHFYRDDDADPTTVGAYSLPFADVIDSTLTAVPAGIFGVAGALQGARGGVDISEEDADRIRTRVEGYYARMREQFDDPGIVVPWDTGATDTDAVVAVVAAARSAHTASRVLWTPPGSWFNDPQLSGVAALRVDDNGRVYGHVARWNDERGNPACHIGYPGTCQQVPRNYSGYRYFHTGEIRTADGTAAIGTITLGTSHASDRATWAQACEHYANSGHGVAVGRVGDDEHGIWFAGALCPTTTDEQRYTLGRVTISGDWRPIAGQYELVGLLGVNTGGFPLPRATQHMSLTGAGIVRRPRIPRGPVVDIGAIETQLLARADARNRAAVLATRAAQMSVRARRERAAHLAAMISR